MESVDGVVGCAVGAGCVEEGYFRVRLTGEGEAGHGDAVSEAGGLGFLLERLGGDGGDKDAVEGEPLAGEAHEGNVPAMGRVEASAEERDSHGSILSRCGAIYAARAMLKECMRYRAYLGLGSNLASAAGGPAETVQAAIEALSGVGSVAARSSLYRTAPVGLRDQPYFINAVVCLETALRPELLLEELLKIERRFGRERRGAIPKGPRTLDLDLLLVANENGAGVVCVSSTLTLPHPEMANRRFVLEPLAEIAPGLRHSVLDQSMTELLAELASRGGDADEEVRRV
jgi:2-amino-4-hydroxy-6-hydroxymethyldihydropteridine diphosphokinase